MHVKFKKDAESIVAPNGVFKEGEVYEVHHADGVGFVENDIADQASKAEIEEYETALSIESENRETRTSKKKK